MDDIERIIAGMAVRRAEAEQAPEPVRAFLFAIIDQQESELVKKQACGTEI